MFESFDVQVDGYGNFRRMFVFALLTTAFLLPQGCNAKNGNVVSSQASGSEKSTPTVGHGTMTFTSTTKDDKLKKLDTKALRRLDFRIEGSSCAACLGRIRKRMQALDGVAKVAIAIKKPYGAAVIYDSTTLDKNKIMKEGLNGEQEKVKFLDASDEKIADLPLVLWPKFNQLKK